MRTSIYPMEGAVSETSLPLQPWFPDLYLEFCSAGDPRYLEIRKGHYVPYEYEDEEGKTRKKGCHGQQVHFIIWYKNEIAGIISGGSAVFATSRRDSFFKINSENRKKVINGIVDNVVFRLVNHERNLGSRVLALWEKAVSETWESIYGVKVFGFETFIVREGLMREEVTDKKDNLGRFLHQVVIVKDSDGNIRRGNLYKASNWTYVGETSGSTKGHDGVGLTGGLTEDDQGRRRVFLRKTTPKKDVYCKWAPGYTNPIESVYKSSWKAATEQGTREEKEIARTKSRIRKNLIGRCFYIKAGRLVNENFQQTNAGRIKRNAS